MIRNEDRKYLCEDCAKYKLCEYYDHRRGSSKICDLFDIDLITHDARAEVIREVSEKMTDILADKCSTYGFDCIEAYCDAYGELKDWIAEQLNE